MKQNRASKSCNTLSNNLAYQQKEKKEGRKIFENMIAYVFPKIMKDSKARIKQTLNPSQK